MKRNLFMTFIAMYLLSLLVACSDKRVTGVSKGNDSTLTADYISKISLQEPDRALALIDTMEMNNEERPYAINYMRFVVYNNGLADYKMADYYGKQVLKDSIELKQDCKRYYSLLNTLASIANSNNQFAQSIIYAKKAAEIARDNNMKEYEVGAIGTVALSTIMLGDKDSGFKMFSNNKDMVMKVMSDNPDFATADMAYSFMGNYVESLIADKKYDEVEKNIPDLLYITNKLKTIDNIMDGYAEYRQLHTYSILMNYYDAKGNKKESEKCLKEIMKSDLIDTDFVQAMISEHYFNVKDIKKLAEITAKMRKDIEESEDTISEFFIDYVLEYEKFINKKYGNYREALEKAEIINDIKDSIFKKYSIEDGVRLSKIYETQEKEYLLQVKDAQLSKHNIIFIVVAVMMIIGITFIVILILFNRKVNRRNKTIVSTINQMMQKEGELTRLRLTDNNDAKTVNPEEMRLMQSLDMLKDDKPEDEIVKKCGYRDYKDFSKSFYEHFGIYAEEYRKWSKNISKQEKSGIEEAKHMKDSFIKNMSHEIRTPLHQIFGFVQLLTDPNIQLSDEEKRRYNDIISDQTTYMTRMINKFLELSEYESSDEPLPCNTVSIDETLSIVQSTVPQPQTGVELTFCNKSGKDTLETNSNGLTRILQYLVANAVKFTPSGSISVECNSNADGNVVFSVTDTGKGIPEGDEERIFDRFYKVDSFVPGVGLGLSLVREISKRMNATVTLDRSYKAQGSKFIITLNNKKG